MACFLAPAAEAVVTTALQYHYKKKETQNTLPDKECSKDNSPVKTKTTFSQKLSWLNTMLWGGSFLLAIEHIWHGEVVPWFPFLTAMNNPEDIQPMLMEIATVGTSMAVFITGIWTVMVLTYHFLEKKTAAAFLSKSKLSEEV